MSSTQLSGPFMVLRTAILLPIYAFVFLLIFTSCKKENSDTENPQSQSNERLIAKVKSWLDEQKAIASLSSKTIDSLKEGLDYNQLHLEKYRDQEEFIVVPISGRFKSKNNSDKNPVNYLVMVLKAQDSITKGNIIQYISSGIEKKATLNTFTKIFTYQNLDCSGKFTILSTTDDFKYDLKFETGKLKSVAEQIKREKTGNDFGRINACVAWYLITTVYYDDFFYETFEDYVTTICDDPCNETRVINGRSLRTSCGGGSGGTTIDYTYAISRPWKWDVAWTSNWLVKSYESVTGERNPNENQGGHFTGISHSTSYFTVSMPGYTWTEIGNTPSIDNPQKVYCSVTGKATHNQSGQWTVYTGSDYISFSELFGTGSQ